MAVESGIQRIAKFKLKAAERFNISPKKCHVGHVLIEAFLDRPLEIHQIDGATNAYETNLSILLRTIRLADAMCKSGLQPGERVIIMAPNHMDVAAPFYATHYTGATLCCLDTALEEDEIVKTFANCQPKIVFSQQALLPKINKALLAIDHEAQVVLFDDETKNLEAFVAKHNGTDVNYKPVDDFDTSDVPAWFMLSSGTTGSPKLTVFTYDNLLNGIGEWWLQAPGKIDLYLSLASLQWISAQMLFISTPIKQYTRLQTSAPVSPVVLIQLVNKYKPDVTAWTPYVLAQFVRVPEGVCDLTCFKLIMVAGAQANKTAVELFRKRCPAKLMFAYGMTEILVPIFNNDPDTTPFGSAGKPIRDKYKFKLVDGNGDEIKSYNKPGELWVKGDVFFKEYYNSPEDTKSVLSEDGYFKTGDLFYRDETDNYYFAERQKALVRYYSDWISPFRIEEVIKQHPGVADTCVIGISNADTMELAVATIIPKPNTNIDAQEIFALIDGHLPDKSKLHGGILFMDSFPMTLTGKINRSKLIEIASKSDRILPNRE